MPGPLRSMMTELRNGCRIGGNIMLYDPRHDPSQYGDLKGLDGTMTNLGKAVIYGPWLSCLPMNIRLLFWNCVHQTFNTPVAAKKSKVTSAMIFISNQVRLIHGSDESLPPKILPSTQVASWPPRRLSYSAELTMISFLTVPVVAYLSKRVGRYHGKSMLLKWDYHGTMKCLLQMISCM